MDAMPTSIEAITLSVTRCLLSHTDRPTTGTLVYHNDSLHRFILCYFLLSVLPSLVARAMLDGRCVAHKIHATKFNCAKNSNGNPRMSVAATAAAAAPLMLVPSRSRTYNTIVLETAQTFQHIIFSFTCDSPYRWHEIRDTRCKQ